MVLDSKTQSLARDLCDYALGVSDSERLEDIYRELAEREDSREFVANVREATKRFAQSRKAASVSSNGFLHRVAKAEPLDDPDFEPANLVSVADRPSGRVRQKSQSRTWDLVIMAAIGLVCVLGCLVCLSIVFGSYRTKPKLYPPPIVHRPTYPPLPSPAPKLVPRAMVLTEMAQRVEFPLVKPLVVNLDMGQLVQIPNWEQLLVEYWISMRAGLRPPQSLPEAEFSDAPWNPKHRLALIRLSASRVGEPANEKVRVELNPTQVRSYRVISAYEQLPFTLIDGRMDAALLIEWEPNESAPEAGPGVDDRDLEVLHVAVGVDDNNRWKPSKELALVDPPKSQPASEDFQLVQAIAGAALWITQDPMRGNLTARSVEADFRAAIQKHPRGSFWNQWLDAIARTKD